MIVADRSRRGGSQGRQRGYRGAGCGRTAVIRQRLHGYPGRADDERKHNAHDAV